MSGDRCLLSTGYPTNVTIRGVRFAMLDQLRGIVEVLVTHAALDRIEAKADGRTDYLGRFEKHRERFERIANDKFGRGEFEDDGADRRGSPDHPLGRPGLKRPLARLCAVQPVRLPGRFPAASFLGRARDRVAAVSCHLKMTGCGHSLSAPNAAMRRATLSPRTPISTTDQGWATAQGNVRYVHHVGGPCAGDTHWRI